MGEPAYITVADDGHVTLFWGDGTEAEREAILRGPRPRDARELAAIIEDMTLWAEENGYTVVVPSYDLTPDEPIEIEPTPDDEQRFDPDDLDDLLENLDRADDTDDAGHWNGEG